MKYEKLVERAHAGKVFESLKSGKVLLELKNRFIEQPAKVRILQLIDCLTDSLLYVPMNAIISNNDVEIMRNSKIGDEVQLVNDLRMVPDYLQDSNGKLYIPIFSQEEQVDKEYCSHFSGVWLHISDVINLYKHPRKELTGIILDAQTKPVIFDKNLINVIEDIMQLKENKLKDGEEIHEG